MTIRQLQAFWELCRQGFPLQAEEAAECWEQGEMYELQGGVQVPRDVANLVAQCNWEVRLQLRTA